MNKKTISFSGPRDFTNFLNGQEHLVKEIPILSSIIKMSNLIGVGCKCKARQKKDAANEAYKNVLSEYLTNEDKAKIQNTLSDPDEITFSFFNEETQQDETILTILK